jgi:lipopolysaccharide biosynthesis regulator YciM
MEKWITITEYSLLKSKSISTVRRYIKSGRLEIKEEKGKYLILVRNCQVLTTQNTSLDDQNIDKLRKQYRKLQEENNELRMLVDLYESDFIKKQASKVSLPPLPIEQ